MSKTKNVLDSRHQRAFERAVEAAHVGPEPWTSQQLVKIVQIYRGELDRELNQRVSKAIEKRARERFRRSNPGLHQNIF